MLYYLNRKVIKIVWQIIFSTLNDPIHLFKSCLQHSRGLGCVIVWCFVRFRHCRSMSHSEIINKGYIKIQGVHKRRILS